MIKLNQSQFEQSGLVPVAVLEKVVSKLLVHNERDALRMGLIELIQDWHKPLRIELYSSGQRGFIAHRGQTRADISIHDVLDEQSTLVDVIKLSDNTEVYNAAESRQIQTLFHQNSDLVDLYVPLLQGDIVGAVLVIHGISFAPTNKVVWEQMLAAYNYLNQMLYAAEIDPLTGLMNRLAFERLLNQAANNTEKLSTRDEATYFVLADIDFFKKINDTFGHLYGDEVLILLARMMSDSFRSIDWLFRYGGEEFALVLHDVSYVDALQALERFRLKIESSAFPQVERVTVSIGFSRMAKYEPVSSLIDRADNALYFAKNNGRNQVHSYENLIEQGLLVKTEQESGNIELF